ncbi:hypothetical protein AWE51_08030 [Aquimarina aggregata]|uniref:N-acetyltransferase domain-containing protein n=1 Tax=Aquimarina aggregata TaxID=1642818 RepID=A0A162Z6Q7_9FLAO|nr:hypothetical protein AWE51_08030 [Aquimarina aggregata]
MNYIRIRYKQLALEKLKIQLIKAKEEDKVFLFKLRMQTMVVHLEKAGIFLSNKEHKDRVNKGFKGAYIVLRSNNKVGVLKCIETAETIEIMQLQIAPEYQGLGIGKKVVEDVISRAKSTKKILILKVLKENPAIRLYERVGFKAIGEDDHEFHMKLIL